MCVLRVKTRTAAKLSAWMMVLVVALASIAVPFVASATDADRSYTSWLAVAQAVKQELDQGEQAYNEGNNAGAATRFQASYNSVYVASNFITVVRDTLGQDKVQSQTDLFNSLQTLVYQPNNTDRIHATVTELYADVSQVATQFDADATLLKPDEYARQLRQQIQKERKQLDAVKKKNYGRAGRTWSQVAQEMNAILDRSIKTYQRGKGREAAELINEAYYQYYEKLGFEKNVMNAISGSRVSTVEYQFKECRQTMNNGGSLNDARKCVRDLQAMLVQDAAKLDGGSAKNANPFIQFVTSPFGQAFVILLREGLEAILVVAAIIAYLIKAGHKRIIRYIYLGLFAGIAASGVVAALFGLLFNGSGPEQEITEGVIALIAMVMLLYTSNWMMNRSSTHAWNEYIHKQTAAALSKGSVLSFVLLSFLAVFREGAETVIFYQAIFAVANGEDSMIWAGFATAAAVLVVIFLLIRFASVRIPIRPFFTGTSALMSIFVVVFAGGGVHALIEGDAIPGMFIQGLPTNDWIGFYPYVETIVAQIIAAIVVVVLFVISMMKRNDDGATEKTSGKVTTSSVVLAQGEHSALPAHQPIAHQNDGSTQES